jgi:monoamine oxidase
MAHSPLTNLLKSAFHTAVQQDEEAAAIFNEYSESRRRFLKQAAVAAGTVALTPTMFSTALAQKSSNAHIAIIGAGIAGLNAAYQLQKNGIKATVYEASGRIGGRMFTMHDEFGKGITTDIGGEYVDTTHADILQLAKEFNLPLYDIRTDKLTRKTFYFGGKLMGQADLSAAIKPFVVQLVKDFKSLPNIISYHSAAQFERLDKLSITQYMASIGIKGWLHDFLNVTLTREYGMEASVQSAVNFLIMFEQPVAGEMNYELFGQDHEVFKIKGGSQHLTDALYGKVKDQVKTEYTLKTVTKGEKEIYNLQFAHAGGNITINADKVIIAIPFTILRGIAFNVPMPSGKRKCIDEIGYGNSSKFFIGINDKPWRKHGSQGYTFTDLDFGCGWDSSLMQSETKGCFTVFGGGNFSDTVNLEDKKKLATKFVAELNTIYPGMDKDFSKKTMKFCWQNNPYSKAAYSSFKTGQWSTLAGWEGVPVGQIYFAGEHVSREFQGYMNGAAQTGHVAAKMVMKALGLSL